MIATQLADGAQQAIRRTKHTLNNWYRGQAAIFDAQPRGTSSSASPDPTRGQGLASLQEKRAPRFTS